MKIPIIRINGQHIVGTNSHDKLYIHNNAIHYLSIQSLASTETKSDGICFEGISDWVSEELTGSQSVEMIELENLIELAISQCKMTLKQEKKLRRLVKRYLKIKRRGEKKLASPKYRNTGGTLL